MTLDELKQVVKFQHGGAATFVETANVRETWQGVVWNGTVHVFDLANHPLSDAPMCGLSLSREVVNGGSMPCCTSRQWIRR